MIEIGATINAPLKVVWDKWVSVEEVKFWAFASDDWAAEGLENEVREGGALRSRNFAKDGSAEFILEGKYTKVDPMRHLAYTLSDGRRVEVDFQESGDGVQLSQRFDPETINPEEQQRQGWQAYLDNFKRYVESSK